LLLYLRDTADDHVKALPKNLWFCFHHNFLSLLLLSLSNYFNSQI
jgi:hypothetical protein